ncbi:TPA: glycosyltransferase family 2 protein [Providencia alcalifaciens]
MNSQKLLSVIVPAYNAKNKIDKVIARVKENLDDDVEFIFVDDGSVDGTKNFIESQLAGINNVKVISQENSGPGGARNTGLLASSGKYVWFVDADDDFYLSVMDKIRGLKDLNYDFIDFNIIDAGKEVNTMTIPSGGIYQTTCQ